MPFGLGFFATAGAGGAAGSFDLLETQVLGSSQASITFSSLSSYSSYQHLQIRYTARSSNSGTASDGLWLRFNSDSGSNYSWHRLEGNGSTVTSGAGTTQTWILMGVAPRSGNTANIFTGGVCDILDPFETTKNKAIRSLHGLTGTGNPGVFLGSGMRMNTEAVSSLSILPDAGQNLVTGSRFSLYGIKAA
jgi:hypothetical protein